MAFDREVSAVPAFRRDRVADGVTTYLRTLILTGQLPAGERLRVEPVAALLKLSVTPIRESLLELCGEGYLRREPNRGYVVAELTRSGFEDQVLVLAMIAGELAKRATQRASAAQVDQLDLLERQLIDADDDGDRLHAEDLNFEFHRSINKAAGSRRLAWLAQLHSHYVPRVSFAYMETQPSPCDHQHHDILAAIRRGDDDGARDAMMKHLIESGRLLANHFDHAAGRNVEQRLPTR